MRQLQGGRARPAPTMPGPRAVGSGHERRRLERPALLPARSDCATRVARRADDRIATAGDGGDGMSWVWLGTPVLDFGTPDPDELDGERVVWLHADPYGVLGARPSAGDEELRRAYRRAARVSHPDASSGTTERFHNLQQALGAATGEAEITVEPVSGEWWSFNGFAAPERNGLGGCRALFRAARPASRSVPERVRDDPCRLRRSIAAARDRVQPQRLVGAALACAARRGNRGRGARPALPRARPGARAARRSRPVPALRRKRRGRIGGASR